MMSKQVGGETPRAKFARQRASMRLDDVGMQHATA
jgi:hypothetical protein